MSDEPAHVIADIGDSNGIDLVENPHLAVLVPPELGQAVETRDVFGVDAGGVGSGLLGQEEPREDVENHAQAPHPEECAKRAPRRTRSLRMIPLAERCR